MIQFVVASIQSGDLFFSLAILRFCHRQIFVLIGITVTWTCSLYLRHFILQRAPVDLKDVPGLTQCLPSPNRYHSEVFFASLRVIFEVRDQELRWKL